MKLSYRRVRKSRMGVGKGWGRRGEDSKRNNENDKEKDE